MSRICDNTYKTVALKLYQICYVCQLTYCHIYDTIITVVKRLQQKIKNLLTYYKYTIGYKKSQAL